MATFPNDADLMRAIFQVFMTEVLGKVLMGLFAIILIRELPTRSFADYTFATSIVGMASGLLTASFNRIYIVGYESLSIAKNQASFLGIQFLITLLMLLAFLPFWSASSILLLSTFAMIGGNCLFVFATTVVQQKEEFGKFAAAKFAHSMLMILALLAVLRLWSLQEAWQPLILRAGVMAVIFAVFVGRGIHWPGILKIDAAWTTIYAVYQQGFGLLFLYHAVMAVFANVNIFLLKALVPSYDLATFGAGYRYYFLIFLASSSLKSVFLPRIQKATSTPEVDSIFQQHRRLLAAYIPLAILAAILAPYVLPLLDNGKYPEAVGIFQILCLSAILSFALSPYMTLMMKKKDFHFLTLAASLGTIGSILISYALIRLAGSMGAAVATLLAYGGFNFAIYLRARAALRKDLEPYEERSDATS